MCRGLVFTSLLSSFIKLCIIQQQVTQPRTPAVTVAFIIPMFPRCRNHEIIEFDNQPMPIISKNIKNILCSIRSERKNFTYLNSQFNLVCHERSLKSQFCTVMLSEHTRTYVCLGLLPPEKFGEGVRPALQFCYLFKTCDCPYS